MCVCVCVWIPLPRTLAPGAPVRVLLQFLQSVIDGEVIVTRSPFIADYITFTGVSKRRSLWTFVITEWLSDLQADRLTDWPREASRRSRFNSRIMALMQLRLLVLQFSPTNYHSTSTPHISIIMGGTSDTDPHEAVVLSLFITIRMELIKEASSESNSLEVQLEFPYHLW